ncbi:MAG: Tad domain-containing protein [Ideonella sp.]|nr:Tad domain-containing protein [Ideonella sp.]
MEYVSRPPKPPLRRAQRGQVLVFGLFVAAVAAAMLFFVFNSGQLIREKTKLVNTTDAAVYAAGLLDARTLNYTAYGNRVIVANTIAIAQMNSLQSWLTMLNTAGDDAIVLLSGKYPEMAGPVAAAQQHAPQMQGELVDSGVLGALTGLSDQRSLYTIAGSQFVAFQMLRKAREQAVNDVLSTTYSADGVIAQADPIPLSNSLGAADSEEEWRNGGGGFVRIMGGQNRGRMLATVLAAQRQDPFIGEPGTADPTPMERNWEMSVPSTFCAGQNDRLLRRGKTWISEDGNAGDLANPGPPGYARWTSEDELVEEFYSLEDCSTPQRKRILFGRNSFGSGAAGASGYSGIPDYFDLEAPDPNLTPDEQDARMRMVYGIRVMRKVADTATSEGRSGVKATDKLNAYKAQPAGAAGELVAVAKTETFFRRDGAARLNQQSGTEERPNLFNPFWHTRLADAKGEVNAARSLQGAGGI